MTILDAFSRECKGIYADKSIRGETVANVLKKIIGEHGIPKRIKVDNGPEFISRALDAWAYFNKVELEYSLPGTPTDNAHISPLTAASETIA